MSHIHEQHPPHQTHFVFQMWDQYLTDLNGKWDLESSDHSLGEELEQSPPPASLSGKLRFHLKKSILRLLRPLVVKLRNSQIVAQITRLEQQRAFNCQTVQTLNGFVEITNSELERLRQEVSDHLHRFQSHLDAQQQHLNTLQRYLNDRLEQIEPRIDAFELMIWTLDRRKEALEMEQISHNHRLKQVLVALRSFEQGSTVEVKDLPAPERQDDYTYFVFENRHRGEENTIKKRLEGYIPYFEGCSQVLDIGCARGEFLELLAEQNIPGYGIDLNHSLIQYCKQKGLQVREADAITHLSELEDDSLGGIFMAHLVEHFSPHTLQHVLTLCFHKLQPHAYFIVETPNPCSLYALSQYFYKDISHNNPLHPDALLYLIQLAGFEQAEIVPKSPFPAQGVLKELTDTEAAAEPLRSLIDVVNQDVRQLNALIYGHLDYAIVAKKTPIV